MVFIYDLYLVVATIFIILTFLMVKEIYYRAYKKDKAITNDNFNKFLFIYLVVFIAFIVLKFIA